MDIEIQHAGSEEWPRGAPIFEFLEDQGRIFESLVRCVTADDVGDNDEDNDTDNDKNEDAQN